jgi:translation initiation factor IF-2
MATKKKTVKKKTAKKPAATKKHEKKKTVKKKTAAKVEKKPVHKKVVKKPAKKQAEEKKDQITDKELAFAEEMLFGEVLTKDKPVRKKGVVKKVVRKSDVQTKEAAAKQKPKAASRKRPAGIKKTRIIRKGREKPVLEPDKKEVPAAAVDATVETTAAVILEPVPETKKAKEKKARKAQAAEEKKEKEPTFEALGLTPLEDAIVVIKDDDGEETTIKSAVSYKDYDPTKDDEYEEVEEIVEEIIEEVEYEDEISDTSIPFAKKRPDEQIDPFAQRPRRRKKKRKKKTVAETLAAKDAVKRTLAQIKIEDHASRKRYKKGGGTEEEVEETNVLRVSEFMSVAEIANLMDIKPADVIEVCMKLGIMVTINQRLDFDVISAIVDEFGYKAELLEEYTEESLTVETDDEEKDLIKRSPIVTVMGHVDHGKTSLLDYIRKTNVIATESGGITQHIGAYRVKTAAGTITFLDTPGHEAFATMRARGANVTDLVILVIAADSNVMPQTIESIDHAKAAGVRIVAAINKTDLPTADPQKIKTQLTQHGVMVEDMGGQVVCVEISCKTGENIGKLLEIVALESDILDLKANPSRSAGGTVVESKLDSKLGSVATVLITNGTLKRGDNFVTGPHSGRVKVMTDEFGQKVETAGPAIPVQVLGLSGTPRAGDSFVVVENEKVARDISVKRSQAEKERELRQIKHMSLDDLYNEIKIGGVKDVNLIVKGDVDGSVEALSDAFQKLSTDNLRINIIHKSVGAIKESNILLAAATNAVIIGFHVYPNSKVRELAHKEGVEIRIYKVIYEAVEEMQKALEGMLEPEEKEVILGNAEVRDIFKISKVGNIAGSYITTGSIRRNAQVRVLREGTSIAETKVASLKRVKEDVNEIKEGFECGIFLDNFNDVKKGDIIEAFEMQQVEIPS